MKKIVFISLILISSLFSQTGSIYSNFGIGEINVNPSARRAGLGLSIAGIDNFDINPFNPASVTKIHFVKFLASFRYTSNSYKDFNSSSKFNSGSFENLLFAVPVERDLGMVLTGGIHPFSRLNYKVLSPFKYFDTIPYQIVYEGLGGVTSYFVGLSYYQKKLGSFGVATNFQIGTIDKKLSTSFENGDLINPNFTSQYKFNGVAIRFGYISENIKTLIPTIPVKEFRIGLSYLTSTNLKTEVINLKQGIFIDTTDETNLDIKVPAQLTVGINAKFSDRFNLYVDFLNQDWTKFNTNLLSTYRLVNQNYFSLGVEYLPSSRPEKFYDAVTYRFGLFVKDVGICVNNEKIREYGLRTGVSLPIDPLNLIDFGVQYSIRGKNSHNLVKESVFSIWLGINFAEVWFVRSEE